MRKFAEIIESTTVAPPTNCLWIKGNDALYFTNGKWVSLFKKEDFINITDRFNKHSISLIEAIQTVPTHQRIDGLVITFEDINGDWRIYQFRGDAVNFFDENKWTDLYDYTNYIVKSITPDEEDLTVSKPDKNGNAIVSLKDRVYDESNFSGKGYKILRKNIKTIDGVRKNILTQNMINKPNTIYEIRYEFSLDNEELTIPNNCVLKFVGGKLKTGIISGDFYVDSIPEKCVFDNIQVQGHILNTDLYVAWFDNLVEEYKSVFNAISAACYDNQCIHLTGKTYPVVVEGNQSNVLNIQERKNVTIAGHSAIIKLMPCKYPSYSIVNIKWSNNITIKDLNIEGDRLLHDYTSIPGTHEFGYGISIGTPGYWDGGVEKYDRDGDCRVIIDNCNISQCTGDGIVTKNGNVTRSGKYEGRIDIKNCDIRFCRRQGISVLDTGALYIDSCNIQNIGSFDGIASTAPVGGIDIEPASGSLKVVLVDINNTHIHHIERYGLVSAAEGSIINGLIVRNSTIENPVLYKVGAKFYGCYISSSLESQYTTNLRNAILYNTTVDVKGQISLTQGVKAYNTSFICEDETSARLWSDNTCIFEECVLENLSVTKEAFIGCSLSKCIMTITENVESHKLYGTKFHKCELKIGNTNKVQVEFSNCVFDSCRLNGTVKGVSSTLRPLVTMRNCTVVSNIIDEEKEKRIELFGYAVKHLYNCSIQLNWCKGEFSYGVEKLNRIYNSTITCKEVVSAHSFDYDSIMYNSTVQLLGEGQSAQSLSTESLNSIILYE